jgi:phosphinothricin acetyltransferase
MIRPVKPEDAEALCGIYNYYIENTVITFEEDLLSPADMEKRMEAIRRRYPYFVWEDSGAVLGYAYANTFKERAAYRFSIEDTVYLKPGFEGRGIGKKLLTAVFDEAKKANIHAIVSCITIPNERSVGLHERLGFVKTAHFREVGFKLGRWLDVGYWELLV